MIYIDGEDVDDFDPLLESEWITIQDLQEEYGPEDLPTDLLDDGSEVIAAKKVNESITSARLLIERYLRRAGIDLPPTPAVRIELKECIYNITRYYYSDRDGSSTDRITERYKMCIEELEKIASGKTKISSEAKNSGMRNIRIWRT